MDDGDRDLSTTPPSSYAHRVIVKIKRNNMELQFWGYELGNVFSIFSGAGGFIGFYQTVSTVLGDRGSSLFAAIWQLVTLYPDATVTLGLGILVLVVPTVRARVFAKRPVRWLNVFDLITTLIALIILGYSLLSQASWIAIASSCFVVASCLLRQSRHNPLLLKTGGLVLALGGIGLALFGLEFISSTVANDSKSLFIMGTLTLTTGLYVFIAGLLTYEGGIFATHDLKDGDTDHTEGIWLSKVAHPLTGLLACSVFNHCDKPVMILNYRFSKPAIFWVSRHTRLSKPFKTSMLARLPWRVLTGMAALLSMTPAGFAFFTANICWALGDVAIGSEDW